jgi:hypothetical protein
MMATSSDISRNIDCFISMTPLETKDSSSEYMYLNGLLSLTTLPLRPSSKSFVRMVSIASAVINVKLSP